MAKGIVLDTHRCTPGGNHCIMNMIDFTHVHDLFVYVPTFCTFALIQSTSIKFSFNVQEKYLEIKVWGITVASLSEVALNF